MRIWHDGSGQLTAWNLEAVEVLDSSTNTHYYFDAGFWLSEAEGLERTIKARRYNSRGVSRVPYKVVFQTGTRRQAGTDANVSMMMHGSSGSTGFIRIPVSSERVCGLPRSTACALTLLACRPTLLLSNAGAGMSLSCMLSE